MVSAIWRLVKPSQTKVATLISLAVKWLQGGMAHKLPSKFHCVLFFKHGGGKPDPLAAFANAGPQEQRAQMLLHGARANTKLAGDLLIAASLHQQLQNLMVSRRDLDF